MMLRTRVTWTGWGGEPGVSTFYFFAPLENAEAAAAVITRVHTYCGMVRICLPPVIQLQVQGLVDVLNPDTGLVYDTLSVTPPIAHNGTANPTGMAPAALAINGQFTTNTFNAGRRLRGRTYISPIASKCYGGGGEMTLASKGDAIAALNALVGLVDEPRWLGVWHRPKNGTGGVLAPVTAVSVPDKLAVLRSRRD